MKKMLKNNKGFSLVELMIVVAIIGILAAIAVPNYQKFVRKSKQAGGKALLTSYYTAAKATMSEMGVHIGNFPVIGFKPEGELNYRLDSAATQACALLPNQFANASCNAGCVSTVGCLGNLYNINAGAQSWFNHTTAVPAALAGVPVAGNTNFTVTVNSNLGGAVTDQWQITQNKTLTILQDGTN